MATITFTIPNEYIPTVLDAYLVMFGPVLDENNEPIAEPTQAQKAALARAQMRRQLVGVIKEAARRTGDASTASAIAQAENDAGVVTIA